MLLLLFTRKYYVTVTFKIKQLLLLCKAQRSRPSNKQQVLLKKTRRQRSTSTEVQDYNQVRTLYRKDWDKV